MSSSAPLMLNGLGEIADQYSAAVCDVWGVIHNGQTLFPGVLGALEQFRKHAGPVILLSNAPRPASTLAARLTEIGLPPDAYDGIMTSGEATRMLLRERGAAGQRCYHVGPDKDADLIANLPLEFGTMGDADFILLSGLYDDLTETPEHYADHLAQWRARDLDLICANPDRLVPFGDRLIYCAGAIAERYEQMGGQVLWVGKPYPLVYEQAIAQIAQLGARTDRVLAIGDGPKTDIAGANQFGLDALFVRAGLARDEQEFDLSTAQGVQAFLDREQAHAHASIGQLQW